MLSNVSLSPRPAPNIAVDHLAHDKGIKKGSLTPASFIPSLLQQRAVLMELRQVSGSEHRESLGTLLWATVAYQCPQGLN